MKCTERRRRRHQTCLELVGFVCPLCVSAALVVSISQYMRAVRLSEKAAEHRAVSRRLAVIRAKWLTQPVLRKYCAAAGLVQRGTTAELRARLLDALTEKDGGAEDEQVV